MIVVWLWILVGLGFAASYDGWADKSISGRSKADLVPAVLFGPIFLIGVLLNGCGRRG